MRHFHHCPFCYEAFACEQSCTICPDLEDRGREFGSHTVCHRIECQILQAAQKYDDGVTRRRGDALRRLGAEPPGCSSCGGSGCGDGSEMTGSDGRCLTCNGSGNEFDDWERWERFDRMR